MALNIRDVVCLNSARGIAFTKEGTELIPHQLTISDKGELGIRKTSVDLLEEAPLRLFKENNA